MLRYHFACFPQDGHVLPLVEAHMDDLSTHWNQRSFQVYQPDSYHHLFGWDNDEDDGLVPHGCFRHGNSFLMCYVVSFLFGRTEVYYPCIGSAFKKELLRSLASHFFIVSIRDVYVNTILGKYVSVP